ncbi:U3 small nucleolar RNA-associated protein 7 [Pyrus ussuriensis x Pyrus communis]|uniref:U3 small nucleolar RNA-associated protein 7 n=1 Tax=Pyrus ussuriensis x Pyrus communis TaxID=2448454 RepID=A0A5N5G425_9ROSA|nr:U3 small nucleolar RNA-associated protein 7 [Pyrus ussuriensis x Pyrus communis]
MGVKQDGGTIDTVPAMKQEKISDELDKRVKKFLRGAEANLKGLKDKKLKGQLAVKEELYGKSAQAAAKAEKMYVGFEGSGIPFSQDYWIGPYLHVLLSLLRAGMHENLKLGIPFVAFFVLADAIR